MGKRPGQIEFSWRDGVITMLVVLVGLFYLVTIHYIYFPVNIGVRSSIAIFTLLSVLIFGFSSFGIAPFKDTLIKVASYVGVIIVFFSIFGLVTGFSMILHLMVGTIIIFWFSMIAHHYTNSVKRYMDLDPRHHIRLR